MEKNEEERAEMLREENDGVTSLLISDQSDNSNEDDFLTSSEDENDNNISNVVTKPGSRINFILTNARSLAPKISSLIHSFEDLDLDFAIVSESWLKQDSRMNEGFG